MLLAGSFPKFGSPACAWVALAPLIVAVALVARRPTSGPIRALFLGFLTGFVSFAGTLYWVVGVIGTFGGLPTGVPLLIGILLWTYLAIFPAVFALLLRRAIARFGIGGVWLAPLLWTATEWLRSYVGLGFPWELLGASQAPVVPIVQVASVVGVFGLSVIVALVSAAAAAVTLSRAPVHRRGAIAVAALIFVIAAGGAWRVRVGTLTKAGRPVRVGLVQGSVEQVDKYDTRFRDAILRRYLDLSQQTIDQGADVVIWPEASTPFFFDANSVLAAPVRRMAVETRRPFILGTDEYAPPSDGLPARYFNSAVLVGTDGRTHATYRKMRLVPFGEYVPAKRLLFFVGPLVQAVSDYSAGTTPVVFDAAGRRVSVAICYESVYPDLSRTFTSRGSELLATITNDAWFDRSSAAYQHFDQGGLRAVEEGRYFVRAANTGISGAVDPYGRVLAKTDLFLPLALTVDVRLLDVRTLYNRLGDVAAWAALATALAVLVPVRVGRRRRRSRGTA